MTSSRPYLMRAVYEWIRDNDLTPQLVVDATVRGVRVPASSVKDGRIVLNISDRAVRGLTLGNERVEFSARFGGTPHAVSLPVSAVLAVVARETGAGMSFPAEEPQPEPTDPAPVPPRGGRPSLKVVK